MDHFGIGAAVEGAVRIYTHSARRTGRTTSLVESLKDGDRVVFVNRKEADHTNRLCLERGVKIECLVIDPKNPRLAFDHGTSQGRTLFDHSWVEQFYLRTIEQAREDIDYFQRELSGFGAAHIETRLRAEEIAKWRF